MIFDEVTQENAVGFTWAYSALLLQLHGAKWFRCLYQVEDALVEIARRPHSELLLMMSDTPGRLVGSAQATYCFKPAQPKVYINSVVVSDTCRGQGLGTLLMNELQVRCQARWPQVVQLELTSGPKRNTQRFYGNLGYQSRTKETGDETVVYVKRI